MCRGTNKNNTAAEVESVMEVEMATAAPFHGVPRLSLNGNTSHSVFKSQSSHHSHEILASHFSTPSASHCYNIDQYCINRELMGKRKSMLNTQIEKETYPAIYVCPHKCRMMKVGLQQ